MVDPIFKNRTDLKREYRILVKSILPSLNDCGIVEKWNVYTLKSFQLIAVIVKINAKIVMSLINQKIY